MRVYWCYFVNDDEWGCYVIAPTRGKAKSLFLLHTNLLCDGDYTDIRCRQMMKLPEETNFWPQVLDDPDDPLLMELGLRYATYEEAEALGLW